MERVKSRAGDSPAEGAPSRRRLMRPPPGGGTPPLRPAGRRRDSSKLRVREVPDHGRRQVTLTSTLASPPIGGMRTNLPVPASLAVTLTLARLSFVIVTLSILTASVSPGAVHSAVMSSTKFVPVI